MHAQSTTTSVTRPTFTELHNNTAVHEQHVETDSIAELQPSTVHELSCGWTPQQTQGQGRMANYVDLPQDVPMTDALHEKDKAVTHPIGTSDGDDIEWETRAITRPRGCHYADGTVFFPAD